MPFTPQPPFPKKQGDSLRSIDWNEIVAEVQRLDRDKADRAASAAEVQRLDSIKVNRAGDTITGDLTVRGALAVGGPQRGDSSLNVTSGRPIHLSALQTNGGDWVRLALSSAGMEYHIAVGGPATAKANTLSFWSSTGGRDVLSLTASGNVGVTNERPEARLHVVSELSGPGGNDTLRLQAPAKGPNVSHAHWGPAGSWFLRSASPAGLVVLQDSGGNVAIGRGDAAAQLHLNGSMKIDGNNFLEFGAGTAKGDLNNGVIAYQRFTDGLDIVGATVPNVGRRVQFHCQGGGVRFFGPITPQAGNSPDAGIMFPINPGGGGGDAAWIRYYPRTGEATTFEIGTSNDADDIIALVAPGGVLANGRRIDLAGFPSDMRLKTDVTPLSAALDKVLALRGVLFNWQREETAFPPRNVGVIAQEVAHVLPQIVQEDRSGDLFVDYNGLIPLLIEAVKQLHAEVEGLRTQAGAAG